MLHFLDENAEQIGIAGFFVRHTRFCSISFLDWVALSLQNNATHVTNLKYIDIDSWLEHASFEDVLTENGDLFIPCCVYHLFPWTWWRKKMLPIFRTSSNEANFYKGL